MCLCEGGGGLGLLIRRGLGLAVIVDHADITDDELVGIACYCCFNIVTYQKRGVDVIFIVTYQKGGVDVVLILHRPVKFQPCLLHSFAREGVHIISQH